MNKNNLLIKPEYEEAAMILQRNFSDFIIHYFQSDKVTIYTSLDEYERKNTFEYIEGIRNFIAIPKDSYQGIFKIYEALFNENTNNKFKYEFEDVSLFIEKIVINSEEYKFDYLFEIVATKKIN